MGRERGNVGREGGNVGTEGAGGPASATGPEQGPCDHAPPCVRLSHVSLTSLSRRPSRRLSRRLSRHFIPLFRALRSSRALAPNPLPAFYLLHRCRGVHSRGPTRHHRGLRKRRAHREEDRICANPLRRDCTFRLPAPCAPTPPQPPPQHLAARAPPHHAPPHHIAPHAPDSPLFGFRSCATRRRPTS